MNKHTHGKTTANTAPIPENDKAEFVGQVIDIFEDFLDEKHIVLDNDEKAEDEDAANIYGTDYGYLQQQLEELLRNWNLTN